MFDKNPEFGRYLSSESTDTDEDDHPIQWLLQNTEVPIFEKGKEKVVEEESKRRPFTRSDSRKLMGDAMKTNESSTADNRKKRTFKVSQFQMPFSDGVEVSGEESGEEHVREVSDGRKEHQMKKGHKGKTKSESKSYVSKKVDSKKGNGKALHQKGGS